MRVVLGTHSATVEFDVYHFADDVEQLEMVFRKLHIALLPFSTVITLLPHIFFLPYCTAKLRVDRTKELINIVHETPINHCMTIFYQLHVY